MHPKVENFTKRESIGEIIKYRILSISYSILAKSALLHYSEFPDRTKATT